MTPLLRLALAAALTLALASPLSAQTPGPHIHSGLPPTHLVVVPVRIVGEMDVISADQNLVNPPSAVHQPGSKTRLIVALALGGACVFFGIMFHNWK